MASFRTFLIVALSLFAIQAGAYVSSISASVGSAGRAAIEAADTPFMNPAGVAYLRGYNIATGFARSKGTVASGLASEMEEWAVVLTDNMPDTAVPSAFGYVQKRELGAADGWNQRDMRLAVAKHMGTSYSLGLGLAYRDEKATDAPSAQQLSFSVGGLMAITPDLGAALVFENAAFLMSSGALRESLRPVLSTGIGYNISRQIRARFDVSSQNDEGWKLPTFAAGIENYLNQWIIFRIGAAHNGAANQGLYTAGLGFAGPRFGIHYAYQSTSLAGGGRDQQEARHSIDLAMPIW